MSATITENDNLPIGHFTPFNDAGRPKVVQATQISNTTQSNTLQIDRFRQGVNIRLSQHLYQTTQPKIWSGRLDHQTRITTFGQARSFVEYDDSTEFQEKPEFDPVWYVESKETYPFPIIFNDGPQQEEEASIEPFIIPMRKKGIDGPFYPRGIKASLEDGNGFDDLFGGTSRVEQFIDYNPPLDPRFFLDEGQAYWGTFPTASHLSTEYDPIALFTFENGDFTDSSGNGKIIEFVSGTYSIVDGPFLGSQAIRLNGDSASLSSSLDADFQITGALTIEAFIKPDRLSPSAFSVVGQFIVSISGIGESLGTNILGSLGTNFTSSGSLGYFLERSTGADFLNHTTGNLISTTKWWHVVSSREGNATSIYLNGNLVSRATHEGFPEKDPTPANNTQKLWIGTTPGSTGELAAFCYSGSISNVKIIGRALTQEEVRAEYARVFPIEGGAFNQALANSIIVEGFTPVTIRNLDPFDDTRDERLVEQLQTTNQEFIAAVKQLDFDLSEDIRGTFDRKSATAGGDIYGPTASRYGTDSIAYRGLIRGG